jgi:hypothetical protein
MNCPKVLKGPSPRLDSTEGRRGPVHPGRVLCASLGRTRGSAPRARVWDLVASSRYVAVGFDDWRRLLRRDENHGIGKGDDVVLLAGFREEVIAGRQ